MIACRSLVSIMHVRSPMLRSDSARKSITTFIAFLLMLATTFAQAPDEVTPLLKQGETFLHAGQLAQAQEFFENAQRKFPGNADISYDLGTAFFLQHNWQKAIENFQKSLLVKPNQIDPLFYLA